MITIGMAALTGCGYFADNWEVTGNKCQALSSEENATAVVARENVVFMNMESGCAPRLDEFGTRFTDIDIDGHRYPATLLCNRATNNHTFTIVGTPMGQGEQSAQSLSDKAMKAFTGFMGAKVTIEGQSSHFSKGNFTQACRAFLPHRTEKRTTASAVADNKPSLTLDDLNQQYKASHPPEPVTAKPTTQSERAPGVAPLAPEPVALTADIYAQALARAKSTWLMSHPKGKADEQVWVRIRQPDKTLNGEVVRVIRYTTTQPDTGVVSDVDVEISPDGSVGYALSKDRASLTPSVPSTPSTPVQAPPPSTVTNPINVFCTLDNAKHVSVYAADGQDYRYRYTDKNDKTELELKDGLFGVKAFHYYAQLGMGSARYIRFNKGVYDYVLLSKDTGHAEFYGVQAYKNGDLISSHECTTPLNLDTASLSSDSHLDSEKMGEYFTTH
ncbi:hypothetical protein [Hafnia alvei]|uniref:hypothetical protein n=1 Tax=Hafnia alvei TaxID=569 RepID=UPI00345E57C5